MSVGRKTGRVKFFNSQKGYGFIIPEDQVESSKIEEVFVHHTAIHNDGGFKSLAEGEEVEYDLVQGPKGMQAANVSGPGGVSVRGDPNAGRRTFDSFGGQRFGGFSGLGGYGLNQGGYTAGSFALSGQGGYPYGSPNFSSAQPAFGGQFSQPGGFNGNFPGQQSYGTNSATSSSLYAPQGGGSGGGYAQFTQFPQGAGVGGTSAGFGGGNGGFGFGAGQH
jgi:cold shock CspA family protein